MNLFYEKYPTTVSVNGKEVPIITDFREYVRLIDMLKSEGLDDSEKMEFILQYFREPPEDIEIAVDALAEFMAMEELNNPDTTVWADAVQEERGGGGPQKDVFSFQIDYPFIFSAFLQDYGINIHAIPYMHWWEFRMLFSGLSESTEIKQRIMYRSIDLSKIKDKDERRRIEKIQRSIRLPDAAITDYDIGNSFM